MCLLVVVSIGVAGDQGNSGSVYATVYVYYSNIPLFLMIIIVLSEIFSVPMKYSA